MKRVFLIIILAMFFIQMPVYALTDYEGEINNIANAYNLDSEKILKADVQTFIDYVVENIKSVYRKPLKITLEIAAVIIMYSLSKTLLIENTATNTADTVSVITIFLLLVSPTKEMMGFISENLIAVKNFMTSFIPVFSGIIMASGEFFTATVYTGLFITAMVAISNLCIEIIIPSARIYMSVFIADALSPFIKLKSLGEFYYKSVKNIMKISVSLICFLLTLQTTINQGKDTLAVKTGKLITGTAIPIIGSSLQDAVSGIYAGMESIKAYAGVVGLVVVFMIFMPSIIKLAVYWIYTNLLYIFGDILDASPLCKCIRGFIDIIELLLSITSLYMVMFIFSITIIIAVTNGV